MIVSGHIAGVPVEEMLSTYGAPVTIGLGVLVFSRHWVHRIGAGFRRLRRRGR